MNLTNHTIFITGGASGIGLALAIAFSNLGNQVIICGRDAQKLQTALAQNPSLKGFVADVAAANASSHILKTLAKNDWYPSILINNAGVAASTCFISDDPTWISAEITNQIRTNLEAPMRLALAFIPLLKKHKEAAIINVTSGLAIAPRKSSPIYCATKAALRAFTKALRYQMDHAKTNIHVVEILPPVVGTDMTKNSSHSKMPIEKFTKEVISKLKRGHKEIYVGKVKLLKLVHSISPSLVERVMRGW